MADVILKFIEIERNSEKNYKVAYWELDSGIPGPRVLITGAMHGNEIQSPEIIRCFREIAEKKLIAGSCILIPFCNPVAVCNRHAHIDFETGRRYSSDHVNNLNCAWPGKNDGSDTQRLSYTLFNSGIIKEATHCIDLHCWQSMMESTVLPYSTNPISMAMAKASRLPFIKYNPKTRSKNEPQFPCILSDYFNNYGNAAICVEFSGQFLIHHRVLENGIQALVNIFKSLNMIDGELEGKPELPIIIDEHQRLDIKAPADGLFVKANCKLGDEIKKCELIGHIFSEKDLKKYAIMALKGGWLFRYGRQQDSLLCTDPLTAYHVYANKGEVVATLIVK